VGKAIVEYKKALSPGKDYNGPGENNIYPEVNLKLAEIYLDEGLYDLALMHIAVAEEQVSYLQIPELIYNVWYVKAEIYFEMKRYREAISVYEGIIKNDENWAEFSHQNPYVIIDKEIINPEYQKKFGKAYLETGKIKYLLNNFDNAIPLFKMALVYRYDKETALKYLINCYKYLDNNVLAERAERVYGNNN
jgi:tetratricopeptide (TPR) repeat protein